MRCVTSLADVYIREKCFFPCCQTGSEVLEGRVGSTNIYLVLYHESVLVNLIEIMLFHKESLEVCFSSTVRTVALFQNFPVMTDVRLGVDI